MKRLLLEWLISCAVDDGRPLPDWLARRVARDPRLKAFYEQTQLLGVVLQGPCSVGEGVTGRAFERRRRPAGAAPPRRNRAWGFAAAAAASMGWAAWLATASSPAPEVTPQQLATQLATVPHAVSAWWGQAARESQAFLAAHSPLQRPSAATGAGLSWKTLAPDAEAPVRSELTSVVSEARLLAEQVQSWSDATWEFLADPADLGPNAG